MRAGGLAPATPTGFFWTPDNEPAFNEGRGVSPGDAGIGPLGRTPTVLAFNEGRGVSPGDAEPGESGHRRLQRVQ